MDTYSDKLAPWERRKPYYNDVRLGRGLRELKEILKNQTQEMIRTQLVSVDAMIASRDRCADAFQDIGYDMKNIGQGMLGLQAAFEWGISDVIWLIEKNTEDFQEIMIRLYSIASNKKMQPLRDKADEAYARGDIDKAQEAFLELEPYTQNDFSICLSLGIIYLFHRIDRKEALNFFDKAVYYARSYSDYYASYALLYKALIKRDFGLIEEAEKLTRDAMRLSPKLVEAMYQNAQYNALLDRPEESMRLLKKAAKRDIVYCLRINSDEDFKEIGPQITELFEKLRDEKNGKAEEMLKAEKEKVIIINNAVEGIEKLGYTVPGDSSVDLFKDYHDEIDNMVTNNSIFDAHMAVILLSLLPAKLQRKKDILKKRANEIYKDIDDQIKELSSGLAKKKKRGGLLPFLLLFFCGQVVAFPFGYYIGIPVGLGITEGILLVICFYVNVIQPQGQWKEVHAKQSEKDKLERVLKRI